MPAWPFAAASLPVGFAVAQATGVRPLGGLVLACLAAAAVMRSRTGRVRAAVWLAVLAGCFAASHLLADVLGTWGAVAAVTLIAGAAGSVLLDARGSGAAAVHRAG